MFTAIVFNSVRLDDTYMNQWIGSCYGLSLFQCQTITADSVSPPQKRKGSQDDCPGCHWGRWTSPVTIKAVILTTFHFQWLEALNVVKSTVFISSDGMKAIDVATGVVWGRSCAKLMHVYTMGISLRERDVYHTERHLPYIYTKQHPLGIVLDMYFYTIFSKCLVGYIGRQFLWWGYWGQ